MQAAFTVDNDGLELARRGQGADDFADARTRGERRKEGLDLVFSRKDRLAEIQGDEPGERGGQPGVCA
jgi:hypothetical protein